MESQNSYLKQSIDKNQPKTIEQQVLVKDWPRNKENASPSLSSSLIGE